MILFSTGKRGKFILKMELTEDDIKYGFWKSQYDEPIHVYVDDPNITEHKSIVVGFHNADNKTSEIKKWNRKLEDLDNIEYLRTYHKVSQETFDCITKMKNLKGLSIKWSSIRSLESIGHIKKLENLGLGLSTSLESIGPIEKLTQLKTFRSENLKKVSDWHILKKCKELEALGINGGLDKYLTLESLDFVKGLENLVHLSLIKVKISDKSLKPLECLKSLQCLRLSDKWSREEMDQLKLHLPALRYGNVVEESHAQYLMRLLRKNKG